jgi:CheY-like chemotaxis protein
LALIATRSAAFLVSGRGCFAECMAEKERISMTSTPQPDVVAIINSNEDVVEAIRLILGDAGFVTVGAHLVDFKKGRLDLVTFLQEHNPRVIVLDIAPPYVENWNFFQLMKDTQAANGRQFVLTTTNKKILDELVGKTHTIELVGKPFDLDEIVKAVQKMSKA